MTDPLSLESSLSSLITVGTRISHQLTEFLTTSTPDSPNEIAALLHELSELCSILLQLKAAHTRGNAELGGVEFRNVLASCMDKFVQLRMLVNAYGVGKSDETWCKKWRCWNRIFEGEEVVALRVQLEAHKITLKVSLVLTNDIEPAAIKDTANMIETTAKEIEQRLAEEICEATAASAKYQDSSILQRYLTSASSDVSSRTTSPAVEPDLVDQLLIPSISNGTSEVKRSARKQLATVTSAPLPRSQPSYISSSPMKSSPRVKSASPLKTSSAMGPPPSRGSRPPPPPRHKTDPTASMRPLHARTHSLPTNKTKLTYSTTSHSHSHSRTNSLPTNKTALALGTGSSDTFTAELTRIYNEPSTRQWCTTAISPSRLNANHTLGSTLTALHTTTLGSSRDMAKTKTTFHQKETFAKVKSMNTTFESAFSAVFAKMWSKLEEGVTRLTNMYHYFELVGGGEVGGGCAVGVWVWVLERLLRGLLSLRVEIERRHEVVQMVLAERDRVLERAVRGVMEKMVDGGIIGAKAGTDMKAAAKQFETTLEKTQSPITKTCQNILAGLTSSLHHVEKIIDATKDIIPAFGIVSKSGTLARSAGSVLDVEMVRVAAARLEVGLERVRGMLEIGTSVVSRGVGVLGKGEGETI
ncbi:hypothetical protein P167DRAFT_74902 [Morchella conica CCBAS932]|uniref:Azaphilone pigments biosynthesis cluster protein L N-terminal domain-containing protein n=1 Tax=Morchella conica CCBAS932 TaxID=1392247 RepID=A0A3N4KXX7_9PEZI|nr:hypothetical protein P167DRAFT_74902 [Morchella conica CCBAS932]